MKYIVSANDRSIKTNKTNLASAIQTLIDEGYEKVTVQLESIVSSKSPRNPKFKEGDKVRVIDNTNSHGYELGSIVTIRNYVTKVPSGYSYMCVNDNDSKYFVRESDMRMEMSIEDQRLMDKWDDGLENLSPEEKRAADRMYELCKEFIEQYEEQQENEDDAQDDDPEYYNMIDRSDMYRDYKMSQRD